jgi:1,4-dihydroxy-2-naphthoate octaprenyltransferase
MNFSFYQIYFLAILAIAVILYVALRKKGGNVIFRLIGLVGKLSLVFFVVVDMLLPQFSIIVPIYPDPVTLIIMLAAVFFGDYFNADKGTDPKGTTKKKTNKKIK